MLVQYKTLPFILKGHSLHKSEPEKIDHAVSQEFGHGEIFCVVKYSEVEILNLFRMRVVLVSGEVGSDGGGELEGDEEVEGSAAEDPDEVVPGVGVGPTGVSW